jgi:hypothetical protein
MNCKDGRYSPAFEDIPTLHGRAFSVYDRLAIGANRVVQRQVGCISFHAKLQFRWHDMNVLGREPGHRPDKCPLIGIDQTCAAPLPKEVFGVGDDLEAGET